MSAQEVALRRKMRVPQPVQPSLVLGSERQAEDQRARWLDLTRVTLPALAAVHHWPIRLDHCFMRVLLDNAVGGVWHHVIPRPAHPPHSHPTNSPEPSPSASKSWPSQRCSPR